VVLCGDVPGYGRAGFGQGFGGAFPGIHGEVPAGVPGPSRSGAGSVTDRRGGVRPALSSRHVDAA